MKLSLPKNLKGYNGYEIESMKVVRDCMREDETDPREYVEQMIREAIRQEGESGYVVQVFEIKMNIDGCSTIYNAYGDGSNYMDVWVEAVAETSIGFMRVGTYLTRIWSIDGENNISMYKEIYRREKKADRIKLY